MAKSAGPAANTPGAEPPSREQARAYLRLIALGALIGVPAAFAAALFLAVVNKVQEWLWQDLPDALGYSSPPWYLVLGLPVIGAALVIPARKLLPGDGGHDPLAGLSGGPTPVSSGPGVVLAALATLCFGAVLGPEAPLIALGSVIGLLFTLVIRVAQPQEPVAATAGSFASISALFGGPLVGGVLMVEAGLGFGAGLMTVLLPGFVAASLGYVIFVGLGSWGGLNAQAISVPGLPLYDNIQVGDLLISVAVGIIAALLISAVRRIGGGVAGPGRRRLGMPVLLLAGGLAVGVLAQLADALGANSQDVLFSGQASIPVLLQQDSTKILLVLLVAKGLAYAVSLGCGFRGGPVFPAIFLGVALASLATVWFDISPTLALAIGTAAGMTAMTRLLLTSSLLAALLVGSAGVDAIPAAVLAASAAWVTMAALSRRAPPAAAATAAAGAPAHPPA